MTKKTLKNVRLADTKEDSYGCIYDPIVEVTIAPLVSLIPVGPLIYATHQYDGCSYTKSLLNTAICPNLYTKIIFKSLINLDN